MLKWAKLLLINCCSF